MAAMKMIQRALYQTRMNHATNATIQVNGDTLCLQRLTSFIVCTWYLSTDLKYEYINVEQYTSTALSERLLISGRILFFVFICCSI